MNALRMTPDELSDRLWSFAARMGKVVDALADTRLGRHPPVRSVVTVGLRLRLTRIWNPSRRGLSLRPALAKI